MLLNLNGLAHGGGALGRSPLLMHQPSEVQWKMIDVIF